MASSIQASPSHRRRHAVGQLALSEKPENPWTASRCRRLLRPLQARLSALRKVSKPDELNSLSTSQATSCSPTAVNRQSDKRTSDEVVGTTQRKKPRRTYSRRFASDEGNSDPATSRVSDARRGARKQTRKPSPDQSVPVVSTPLLRRARPSQSQENEAESPLPGRASISDGGNCRGPSASPLDVSLASLRALQTTTTDARYRVLEALLRDLDIFLHATESERTGSDSKSLLAMCVRKVPQYVAAVDTMEKEEAQEQGTGAFFRHSSARSRIYDELEGLGCPGRGWRSLSDMARADVLWMLKTAAAEGLFDSAFVGILARHYSQWRCSRDSADLLASLIAPPSFPASRHSQTTAQRGRVMGALSTFLEEVEQANAAPQLYPAMTSAVESRRLDPLALSTKELERIWAWASRALLDRESSAWAVQFASAAIASLCFPAMQGRRRLLDQGDGVRQKSTMTLVSVVGAMAAMAMVSSQDHEDLAKPSAGGGRMHLQSRVLHVLERAVARASRQRGAESGIYILRLAIFLLTPAQTSNKSPEDANSALRPAWGRLSDTPSLYETTAALACSIAHCSGRATSSPSHQYLSRMCDRLDNLKLTGLEKLRKDGAFLLVQKTDDLRDLVFAEGLGRGIATPQKCSSASAQARPFFTGYRWEEGISEWVVASPAQYNKSQTLTTAGNAAASDRPKRRHGFARDIRDGRERPSNAEADKEDEAIARAGTLGIRRALWPNTQSTKRRKTDNLCYVTDALPSDKYHDHHSEGSRKEKTSIRRLGYLSGRRKSSSGRIALAELATAQVGFDSDDELLD